MSTTLLPDHHHRSAVRKAGKRLIPFLGLLYFLSYLDRVNVGFAALTMNSDLQLSETQFGTGAGIFFIGYIAFTFPANMMLQKIGARIWIPLITMIWGVISLLMAFVSSPTEFFVLRFLLGVAEAGFLPGVIVYLTRWFDKDVRGQILSNFFIAIPFATVVGAPLSAWLLGHSLFGLAGWQTMFLVEALPAVVLGIIGFTWLTEHPDDAAWLDAQEKQAFREMAAANRKADAAAGGGSKSGLANPAVWTLGLVYFAVVIGLYGFAFWAPQILKARGSFSTQEVGWLVAIPYVVTLPCMYLWSRHSDRTGERIRHLAIAGAVSAGGFALASFAPNLVLTMVGFSLATAGIFCLLALFWTVPTALVSAPALPLSVALINSLGNLAGYCGPVLMGWLKQNSGSYSEGIWLMSGGMLLAVLAIFLVARLGASRRPATAPILE
jgi:ACS family tartrate transporter-like MFS transporter